MPRILIADDEPDIIEMILLLQNGKHYLTMISFCVD